MTATAKTTQIGFKEVSHHQMTNTLYSKNYINTFFSRTGKIYLGKPSKDALKHLWMHRFRYPKLY